MAVEASSVLPVETVATKPYGDQKPGTSGLRKRTQVFLTQPYYTENFIQATLDVVLVSPTDDVTLVVGGDGRYYVKDAVQLILQIAAANGVSRVIVGQDGILSTPAVSTLIRQRQATGGIILTASHNPGGADGDFGIKYNGSNGGPATEQVTELIYAKTKAISQFKRVTLPKIDLHQLGTLSFGKFQIEIVDSVDAYAKWMRNIFDFDSIRRFLQEKQIRVLVDAMHGVTGPYLRRLFVEELGLSTSSVLNAQPSEDFGGGHPDPNLTYAKTLVDQVNRDQVDFGAAFDGDGDRNMILSHDFFVNPSDSVAMIAAYAAMCIPYFSKSGIKGLARSMPTSGALDRVAKHLNVPLFEVPTGWKFFGNLMDANRLSICGEESFGTGSDHVREKDGIWAALAWLSILAHVNAESQSFISLRDIAERHYGQFGRNYFTRYDYEEIDSNAAQQLIQSLTVTLNEPHFVGSIMAGRTVQAADDFSYRDPIDGSLSTKQGLRVLFNDGSRIIYRLSGTGSAGATLRVYIEAYSPPPVNMAIAAETALAPLIEAAVTLAKVQEWTGRECPTVIT